MDKTIPRPNWPSGDGRPVLATYLSPQALSERSPLELFRSKDDLDWFVGAVIDGLASSSLVFMRHDGNPDDGIFYADVSVDMGQAQQLLVEHFRLSNTEISWAPLMPDK